jgi:thiol-disulfide isomerase/thioredoxin
MAYLDGPRYSGSDFDRLFQQRFNELDSLISSDSSPDFPATSGRAMASSCAPCSSLSAPSQGQTMMQWLALLLLVTGIVVLLIHIFRKMNWRKKKGNYGATLLPSVGQQTAGGTIAAKPAGLDPKGSTGGSSAKEVADPVDIFSSNDSKLALVLFHATWCGHCKELKPIFEAAASQHPDVDFKCVENEVMGKSPEAKKLGVNGFPTVVALKGKKPLGSLVGNQGAAKLQEFIKQMKAM